MDVHDDAAPADDRAPLGTCHRHRPGPDAVHAAVRTVPAPTLSRLLRGESSRSALAVRLLGAAPGLDDRLAQEGSAGRPPPGSRVQPWGAWSTRSPKSRLALIRHRTRAGARPPGAARLRVGHGNGRRASTSRRISSPSRARGAGRRPRPGRDVEHHEPPAVPARASETGPVADAGRKDLLRNRERARLGHPGPLPVSVLEHEDARA
jgi:hypothetical protein